MPDLLVPRPGGLVAALKWDGRFKVEKFWADDDLRRATPYEVIESGPNLLLTAGAQELFKRLDGSGGTAFSSSNARLCVGDGTAAVAIGQTDLQGTNKTRKIVDSAPSLSGNQWSLVATFLTSDANHAWNEAGIANAGSGGVLLNRVVQAFGTKTGSSQWVLTATATLA